MSENIDMNLLLTNKDKTEGFNGTNMMDRVYMSRSVRVQTVYIGIRGSSAIYSFLKKIQ